MIQDDDVLEEKDMYVLERLAEFVKREEVQGMAAGKQLGVSIERTVRPFPPPLHILRRVLMSMGCRGTGTARGRRRRLAMILSRRRLCRGRIGNRSLLSSTRWRLRDSLRS